MFRTPLLAIVVPPQLFLVCISRICLNEVKYRFILSFTMLSAPNLIIKRWLRNYFPTRSCLYLIILPSSSVISWLSILTIFVSESIFNVFHILNLQDTYLLWCFGKPIFGPGFPYSSCRYHFLYLLFYRFRYWFYIRASVKILSKSFLLLRTATYSAKLLLRLVWVANYRVDFIRLTGVVCAVCFISLYLSTRLLIYKSLKLFVFPSQYQCCISIYLRFVHDYQSWYFIRNV